MTVREAIAVLNNEVGFEDYDWATVREARWTLVDAGLLDWREEWAESSPWPRKPLSEQAKVLLSIYASAIESANQTPFLDVLASKRLEDRK